MSGLVRENIGDVCLDQCFDLDSFEKAFAQDNYDVLNAAEVLEMPVCNADEKMLKRIENGRSLGMDATWNLFPGSCIAVCAENELLAIYKAETLIDLNCECKFATPIRIR